MKKRSTPKLQISLAQPSYGKVTQLGVTPGVDQNIIGLNVSVHHIVVMAVPGETGFEPHTPVRLPVCGCDKTVLPLMRTP